MFLRITNEETPRIIFWIVFYDSLFVQPFQQNFGILSSYISVVCIFMNNWYKKRDGLYMIVK